MEIESKATPEQQAKAVAMGWQGPDKYKGDPERFVDADVFLERGETFIPFLKKERETLQAQLAAEKAAREALQATVEETQRALSDLDERYTVETQKRTEAALASLKTQIREARSAGDWETVDKLTDMQEELKEAHREAKAAPVRETEPARPQVDPETLAWVSAHEWFNTDPRQRAIFMGFVEARRASGDTTSGQAFLNAALKDMEDALTRETPSKVASARNGSGEGAGGSTGGKKGYDALPADAKAACDSDMNRFVGKGKKYGTQKEWRDAYANIYFSSEA